jgi:membrane protein
MRGAIKWLAIIGFAAFAVAALTDEAPTPSLHPNHRPTGLPRGRQPQNAQSAQGFAPLPDGSLRGALIRTYESFSNDRIMSVGAGCAFYLLLSLFPALASVVSLYGLVADPEALASHMSYVSDLLPASAAAIVFDELHRILAQGQTKLGFAFAFALAISLWTANSGMKALMDALNVAYEAKERRNVFLLNATSLLFTLLAILFVAVTLGLLVILPSVIDDVGLAAYRDSLIAWSRYPLLLLATLFALAVLYRFGPDRAQPQWKWVTWGSVFATVFWVLASLGFGWYTTHFGSYDRTYGSLGAVAGLMTWLWLSITIVLLGAELNYEIEMRARALGVKTSAGPVFAAAKGRIATASASP